MLAAGDTRPWLDHIAFAVPDLAGPAQLITEVFGGEFVRGGDHSAYGFRTAQFRLRGGVKFELLMPLRDDSRLQMFLDRGGPGVHHVTLMCDDVEVMDGRLGECGYRTVDLDVTDPNWRETYLGPRAGLGTVLQFGDSVLDWSSPIAGYSFADVVAGAVDWHGARMVRRGPEETTGRSSRPTST